METTIDGICRGSLLVEQPKLGYRFNVDSVILARFAASAWSGPPPARVIDLGAGCGPVGMILARLWPISTLTLVELQPDLAALAQRNVVRNGLTGRAVVLEVDLRQHELSVPGGGPTLLVCNPPFFPISRGRMSPNPQVAGARHEIYCALDDLAAVAQQTLSGAANSALALVHLADRKEEVIRVFESRGLRPRMIRDVVPFAGSVPSRTLLLFDSDDGGWPGAVLPPLVVHECPGSYGAELRQFLGPIPG
jgi:tRNA1(Val) A37 N6-methylase TrmN6